MLARVIEFLVWLEGVIGHVLMGLFRLLRGGWTLLCAHADRAHQRFAGLSAATKRQLAAATAAAFLLTVAWQTRDPVVNWYEATAGNRPLLAAQSWYYHLDLIHVPTIQKSNADLVVMDYATNQGRDPLPKDEVAKVKVRSDGRKRLVVAYLSVGESETYRFYWNKAWEASNATRPAWLVAPNCAWPGAWSIRFWDPGWKDIVYRGATSYLKRIIDAGFDGVYLDRVDIFDQFTRKKGRDGVPADPEAEMVQFVLELAETARRLKPGFLIIPQNGEPLLAHKAYRRAIDGLGKEDLLHGHSGTGERNPDADIKWSHDLLKRLLADHKPVFAVEYLVTRESIAYTTLELTTLGLIPTFQDRSLDGSNPTMPRIDPGLTQGTPEWIRTMCHKGNSW